MPALAQHAPAFLPPAQQPRGLQHVQMAGDGGHRDRQGLGEFAHCQPVPLRQACHQGPPRGVGQGGEDTVEGLGRIINQSVKLFFEMRFSQALNRGTAGLRRGNLAAARGAL